MHHSPHPFHLLINIAKRSPNSANQVLNLIRLAINIQNLKIDIIFQALRLSSTHHTRAPSNDLLPISKVLRLPDVPRAIDHGVVEVKVWVSWGGVEILRDGGLA